MKTKTNFIKSLIASVATVSTLQSTFAADYTVSGPNGLDLTSYLAEDNVTIQDFTGYFHNYRDGGDQVVANIILVDADGSGTDAAVTVTDGFSSTDTTASLFFNASLTGSGDWTDTWNNSGYRAYHFNGDQAAFTGDFILNTNTGSKLFFGNGGVAPTGSVTGSGAITVNSDVTFNYSGDAETSSDISGNGGIVWLGTGTLYLSGTVSNTGTNTAPNGGTIAFGSPSSAYFVSPDGDNSDGSTWAKAYNTIDAAIAAATGPAEVWVKGGVDYTLTASITMKSDVVVYGGFAGTEASKGDRATNDRNSNGKIEPWEFATETVIDGVATYRVVDFTGSTGATISGFTIKNGASTTSGAGVLTADNATVEACVISGNTATVSSSNEGPGGGGIAVAGTGVMVDSCFIYGNFTNGEAGGINVTGSGTVQRCIIVNNETNANHYTGAVLLNPSAAFTFAHNIVAMNQGGASDSAGLRVANAGNSTLVNSIIWGNKRTNGNFDQTENIGTLHNIAIQGSTFGTAGLNLNGTNADVAGPNFVTPTVFWGQPADGAEETAILNSDWSITNLSPCINVGADSVSGITLPTEDIVGVTIPQYSAADIGTYEFNGSFPQMYTSSTTTQSLTGLMPAVASAGELVMGIEIVMTGTDSPKTVDELALTVSGAANTSAIKIYSTGTTPTFATDTEIFSGAATEGASSVDIINTALSHGTNYLWITLDVTNTTDYNDVIDVDCTTVTISGEGAQVPTVTAPAGNLKIAESLPTLKMDYSTTADHGSVYTYGFETDHLAADLDGANGADWKTRGDAFDIVPVGGEVVSAGDQLLSAGVGTSLFQTKGFHNGNTAFSFQLKILVGTSAGSYDSAWGFIGNDGRNANGSMFTIADDHFQLGDQVVNTGVDSNIVYNHYTYTYVPSGNNDARGDIYIYLNNDLMGYYRNRIGSVSTSYTWWGDWGSGFEGGFTIDYISFAEGSYAPLSDLTPAIGIDVAQNGTELTWTVGDEIGVKEYQVVDIASGEVIAVVDATDVDAYSVTLPEGVTAKLVVVDNSGFTQSFYPENGDIRTVAYNLSQGWNLITITTENSDLNQLKKAVSGDLWIWNGDAYEVTTSPQPTEGVWVYATTATEVTVSGTKSDAEMAITTGWNLVGPVENSPVPAEATLIYNWNDIYETIATDQGVLLQGVGYWIFSF